MANAESLVWCNVVISCFQAALDVCYYGAVHTADDPRGICCRPPIRTRAKRRKYISNDTCMDTRAWGPELCPFGFFLQRNRHRFSGWCDEHFKKVLTKTHPRKKSDLLHYIMLTIVQLDRTVQLTTFVFYVSIT